MKKFLVALALACAGSAFAASEWVPGEVVKLDPERSLITLKHERIGIVNMDAMTMPFKVKDPALLAPLKVGDKVRFHLLLRDDELVVQHIEVQR